MSPDGKVSILVTGGAGYIGSHAVLALLDAGYHPVVLDDLSTGSAGLVPAGVPLIRGDAGDTELLSGIMRGADIRGVMHFAGSIVVPESVSDPGAYYTNNTAKSLALIRACVASGISAFIFSSTAAVYGEPDRLPISEETPLRPISPYGASKMMTERMLGDISAAHGLAYAALRYFNVAGADPAGRAGQSGSRSTHLIKVACEAVLGLRPALRIYGTDYPAPDGTCIRDYVHVSDLANAHVLALDRLLSGGGSLTLNCGYGRGHSVAEVIDAVGTAAGRKVPVEIAPRRPGDPASLVASCDRIGRELGWTPRHDELATIVRTALAWQRRLAE